MDGRLSLIENTYSQDQKTTLSKQTEEKIVIISGKEHPDPDNEQEML